MRAHFPLLIALVSLLSLQAAPAQEDHDHPAPENLGTVTFTTSCTPVVQPQFNRAVALMHSFQFADAIKGFNAILAADPSCSMSYWGIALSNWGNPFAAGLKSQIQLEKGLKAVEQARANPPRTERERAYIEAVSHLYADTVAAPGNPANPDQHARTVAYETAMSAVSAAYPEDTEAAIFYALALAAAADPSDKTYARQLKAGAILESLFEKYPDHPGLAHYIIHAYDVPPLASRAVVAAQRYSEIAPSTPHALHMPSHTFTRIGDWQASIQANLASAASAHKAGQPPDELHATDYLVYAYLQTAQDAAAEQQVKSAAEIFSRFDPTIAVIGAGPPSAAYFARAAIPARYCLERQDWACAASLEPVSSPYPYTDAITFFARGLGAAHLNDRPRALAAIQSLTQNRDKLLQLKENYWGNQVEIQRQAVAAWLTFAGGDSPGAITAMRAAAELEDKTEKSAVTPGPLAPARELLGELLLQSKQPAQALKEFEDTLTKEPNRFRSLYGAAEAARQAGDQAAAQTWFQKLIKVAEPADHASPTTYPGQPNQFVRPELAEARAQTQPK